MERLDVAGSLRTTGRIVAGTQILIDPDGAQSVSLIRFGGTSLWDNAATIAYRRNERVMDLIGANLLTVSGGLTAGGDISTDGSLAVSGTLSAGDLVVNADASENLSYIRFRGSDGAGLAKDLSP
jgi:hypothetical protein